MEQQNKKCEKSSSNGILRKQQRMSSIFRQIFLSVLLVKKYRQTPLWASTTFSPCIAHEETMPVC